jgi:hypothetical protein
VQEATIRDPPLLLYQELVHNGNLPGRAAEADETQFQPKPERLPERWFYPVSFAFASIL